MVGDGLGYNVAVVIVVLGGGVGLGLGIRDRGSYREKGRCGRIICLILLLCLCSGDPCAAAVRDLIITGHGLAGVLTRWCIGGISTTAVLPRDNGTCGQRGIKQISPQRTQRIRRRSKQHLRNNPLCTT